jgi:hypothetical protein
MVCAIALAFVLTKSGPNSVIAVLCAFVTVLCVQIAFLRRELSELKNSVSGNRHNES